MGQFQVYNKGLDMLNGFASGTWKWALFKSSSFNRDHDFMDDLVAGTNEISVGGYSRLACSTPTRTVNTSTDRIEYSVSSVSLNFGNLTAGTQTPTALILLKHVTNDTDSVPVLWADLTSQPTTAALNPYIVTLTSTTFAYITAGSGS